MPIDLPIDNAKNDWNSFRKVFVNFKKKDYFKIIIILIIRNVYKKKSFVKAICCTQYFIHSALNLLSQCKRYAIFIIIQQRYV